MPSPFGVLGPVGRRVGERQAVDMAGQQRLGDGVAAGVLGGHGDAVAGRVVGVGDDLGIGEGAVVGTAAVEVDPRAVMLVACGSSSVPAWRSSRAIRSTATRASAVMSPLVRCWSNARDMVMIALNTTAPRTRNRVIATISSIRREAALARMRARAERPPSRPPIGGRAQGPSDGHLDRAVGVGRAVGKVAQQHCVQAQRGRDPGAGRPGPRPCRCWRQPRRRSKAAQLAM